MDEDTIVYEIESKEKFTAEEIERYLSAMAKCIKDGTPSGYFSQVMDKLLDNEMSDRDAEAEEEYNRRLNNGDD